LVAALSLAAMLSACVGGEQRKPVRTAAPPPPPFRNNDPAFRQCAARLDANSVRYTDLPNEQRGAGCGLINTLKVIDLGVPTTNVGPMTCPLAAAFAGWARYGVAPAARLYLGAQVVKIETFGTYACRNIVGSTQMAGKRSEHAHANAIDISAFVLSDGRRITIQDDWRRDGATAQFLRIVRQSACKRFATVLSPDYNAAHYNHFHLDMGGRGGICR
jgi:hypothetical protein